MIITNQSKVNFLSVLPDDTTIPGEKESNIVSTEIISITFAKLKQTPTTFIGEGQNTTQTVTLTNNTSQIIKNLFFNDSLGLGASHVPSTVTVDNVAYPNYDIAAGFSLPDLPVGASTAITYTVLADNPKTQDIVNNFGTVNYSVETPLGTRDFTENTNTVSFAVVSTKLDVVKSVDKTVALKGEILNYKSKITNTGSQKATNVVFSDILQPGLTFVDNSVKINSVSYPGYNPINSFTLPDINAGDSVEVDFQALVN